MAPRSTCWIVAILLAAVLPGELLSAQKPAPRKTAALRAPKKALQSPARMPPSVPGQRSPSRPQLALQLGHSQAVMRVAFSGDGQTLVTAGADQTTRLWDVQQGE